MYAAVAVFLGLLVVSQAADVGSTEGYTAPSTNVSGSEFDADLNIIELADRLNAYSFLLALQETNLTETVRRASSITVFVPTNAAFLALSDATRADLRANPKAYQALLKYHVVQGIFPINHLDDEEILVTLNDGAAARFNIYNHTAMKNISTYEGAVVSGGNYTATNGMIHFIEEIVQHIPTTQTTLRLVNTTADLSKLALVLKAAKSEKVNALLNDEVHTLFAPNNEAFGKWPAGAFDRLTHNPQHAEKLLLSHITKLGTYFMNGVIDKEVIPTNDDSRGITVDKTSVPIRLNSGSNVVSANNATTNGVVHVIDTTLYSHMDFE